MPADSGGGTSMTAFLRTALIALLICISAPPARGQCHEWSHDFALAGFDDAVLAYATFDEGQGPVLFVGGAFRHVGELEVNSLARWDGARWSAVGGGFDGVVSALAAYDDGTGPHLYAGGNFTHAWTPSGPIPCHGIARWNGDGWSALGTGSSEGVDGAGLTLMAGGWFTTAGGVSAPAVARWNNGSWSALGAGFDSSVDSLAVFDEGAGPRLFAGGTFASSGSVPLARLARWDGGS